MNGSKAILFVCPNNACYSQIAEAIAKESAPATWLIDSVGPRPVSRLDPKAVELLRRKGLPMPGGKRPKCHFSPPLHGFDCVVEINCPDAGAHVPAKKFLRWNLPDLLDGPMERYEELFADIKVRIEKLIGGMAQPFPQEEAA